MSGRETVDSSATSLAKTEGGGLVLEVGVAKINKYASRESGDTVEVVERPAGGLSLVMLDGQGSGQAAKALSLLLSTKAVTLLKDGVRDGAVARAVHDFLFASRQGRVSAALDIVSAEFRDRLIVVTRNSPVPMFVRMDEAWRMEPSDAQPVGLYRFTRPALRTLPLQEGVVVVVVTDGITGAGMRAQRPSMDLLACCNALAPGLSAPAIAEAILDEAMRLDDGRPSDDMSVGVLRVAAAPSPSPVRRLAATVPLA